jgi:hypothetical protein
MLLKESVVALEKLDKKQVMLPSKSDMLPSKLERKFKELLKALMIKYVMEDSHGFTLLLQVLLFMSQSKSLKEMLNDLLEALILFIFKYVST